MGAQNEIALFEERRALLTGLAYRILGSLTEAEDAVQDTYFKWRAADRDSLGNPAAWLTTACTRRCIDMLRAGHRVRVDYVGAWLPEPIQIMNEETPEATTELSQSLSVAFLMVLERLAPKERAAYLLHEIFDQPYSEVAATLGVGEPACRKLVSRAKLNIRRTKARSPVPAERQEVLLAAFKSTLQTGITEPLAALMSEDVTLKADGGGKVPTLLEPLFGVPVVLEFIGGQLGEFWKNYQWQSADINGSCGAILLDEGRVAASISFAYDVDDKLSDIFIVRNPEKLAHITQARITLK